MIKIYLYKGESWLGTLEIDAKDQGIIPSMGEEIEAKGGTYKITRKIFRTDSTNRITSIRLEVE